MGAVFGRLSSPGGLEPAEIVREVSCWGVPEFRGRKRPMLKLSRTPAFTVVLLAPLVRAQGPTPYCTAGTSTSGCTPSISANVQPDTANGAGCVITTSGVEGQKDGVVFYGVDNIGFTPVTWGAGSSSLLCVKPPTARLGAPTKSGGGAGLCDGTFAIDWDAFQLANPTALGAPWSVGRKIFVQSWYRDPGAPRNANLSNALELTLLAPAPIPCVSTIPGMVAIPPGTFDMGSNAAGGAPYYNLADTQPVHQVTISYCFWMGATEVTQDQFSGLMGFNHSTFPGGNRPIETVPWWVAREYCFALTAQQSALGAVPVGYEYRLPTEAEWEYACRAGTTTEFSTGIGLFCGDAAVGWSQHSNSSCNLTGTSPVASFAPNAFGLHDMHGNVWEWRLDSYKSYSAGPVTDPFVTGNPIKVLRGGAWNNSSQWRRSTMRGADHFGSPPLSGGIVGFRVVLGPIFVP
jgi:formylglycine-generating enzyme required for sulfatase activity